MQNNTSGSGYLQVSVFNETESMPVGDATVQISPTGSEDLVVEETKTNSTGQSDTVGLPAPALELSLEPETQIRPYSEYDLTVSAEGFMTVKISGVQIKCENMHSDYDHTIWEGVEVHGYPVATYSRGQLVYRDGEFLGERGWGSFVKRTPRPVKK